MNVEALERNPERYLRDEITAFTRRSPLNRLWRIDDSPIWDDPLVGFADGDDPLFMEYKRIIGDYHLTPRELIRHAADVFGEAPHRSLERVSVISWVFPTAAPTRESNRVQEREPSRRWIHTRYYGEGFSDAVRAHLVDLLTGAGYLAIAMPMRSPLFRRYDHEMPNSPTSNWSERHIAYAAGLGTFSLNDGFITPRGMAIRCGSVVTNLPLQASPRPYRTHVSNCLYLDEGTCGECIERCPANAISTAGHDKMKCFAYVDKALFHLRLRHSITVAGCGLCQTGVPCEAAIPARRGKAPS